MSMFDPALFLDASIDQPMERRDPLPAGDYKAVIGEVTTRNWTGKQDTSKSGVAADVPLEIDIPAELAERLGYSSLKVKDSIMMDLTAGGTIDYSKGKNNHLRTYREALDMNKAGDSFSLRKMTGRVVLVKISHEEWNGALQERVKGVAKA